MDANGERRPADSRPIRESSSTLGCCCAPKSAAPRTWGGSGVIAGRRHEIICRAFKILREHASVRRFDSFGLRDTAFSPRPSHRDVMREREASASGDARPDETHRPWWWCGTQVDRAAPISASLRLIAERPAKSVAATMADSAMTALRQTASIGRRRDVGGHQCAMSDAEITRSRLRARTRKGTPSSASRSARVQNERPARTE